MIDEMSSAVKHFLKVQSTVKKLQGTITKLLEQLESQKKFKVITQQVVKPLTPAIDSFLARDAEELDMPYHHIQGRIKNISFLQSDTSEEDIPEGFYAWDFKPGYDSDSSQEEITPKKNSSPNDKIGMQHCHQCALVATPRKHRLTFDTPVSPDTPDSDIEQLMRLGPKKFSWHPAMETTMATDNADAYSEASEFDTSRQSNRLLRFNTGNQRSEMDSSTSSHPRQLNQKHTQAFCKLSVRCTDLFTPTRKNQEILEHFTWETSITTPAKKIYAKLWIQFLNRYGWRRLQFQE